MASVGLCFTSDIITSDQNWHHLYSSSAGQEEKIFPLIPRSEWLAQWSLRYAWKCLEIWVRNSRQNFLRLHLATPRSSYLATPKFFRNFWTGSKPSRRSISAAKRWEKEKMKRWQKKIKRALRHRSLSRPKTISEFWFLCMPEQKCCKNAMPVERTACCHFANAFLSRLELIWPISRLKISKMSKKCVFGKKLLESMG